MSQPYGPIEEQQLSAPNVHQQFCVYPVNKFILSSVGTLKSLTLPESEQCTLYCTMEPDCFFTEYNPGNGKCRIFKSFTICGNYRWKAYEMIFSWKIGFTSQSSTNTLCEQLAQRTVGLGGGCLPKTNQTLQYYSDKEYFLKYGPITGVVVWKKGFFRAVQFK